MSADLIGEAVVDLMILAGFLLVLGVGGIIADYVFPHIKPLQHWLDSLPDYEDDEATYEEYLLERRAKRQTRRCRAAAKKRG